MKLTWHFMFPLSGLKGTGGCRYFRDSHRIILWAFLDISRNMTKPWVLGYRKFPKCSDTPKICCNHSKIWTMWLYHRVMSPNDADGMANSVDPDQIWVSTVCPGIPVRKLRIITVPTERTAKTLIWLGGCHFVGFVMKGLIFIFMNLSRYTISFNSLSPLNMYPFNLVHQNLSPVKWNCLWEFATRSHSNQPAQLQRLARILKFRI